VSISTPPPLRLHPGATPALVLKCAAAGLFDSDTVSVFQPKSALALGETTSGCIAQGRKQARARGTAPEGGISYSPSGNKEEGQQ